MKLLLIYPPERSLRGYFRVNVPALGAACLAAAVRDRAEVQVLDAKAEGYEQVRRAEGNFEVYGLSLDEIQRRIAAAQPDLVGVTCLASFNWPEVREVVRRTKAVNPQIMTLTGGTHPSFLAEPCLRQEPALDGIVLGEGESTLLEIVERLAARRSLAGIQGLAQRGPDGGPVIPAWPEPIRDLDSLPFPARDLLPMETYFRTSAPFSRTFRHRRNTSIMTSRGCPAHCTFCSSANFWGHNFRGRSPARVIEEMELLQSRYGVRELQFIDDNLLFDRERATAIFQGMIKRRLNLEWCMPNGAALWRLDLPLLRLMREAGCYSLTLAFESGNQEVLSKIIKKPLNLKQAPELVQEMKRLGIQVHAFFISGFPGETKAQMEDTYRLAEELDLEGAYFFIAAPLPGSELEATARAAGCLPADLDYTQLEYNRGQITTPAWTPAEVERITGRFYLRFQLRAWLRHPRKSFRYYGRTLLERPGYVLRHLFEYARRLWPKA